MKQMQLPINRRSGIIFIILIVTLVVAFTVRTEISGFIVGENQLRETAVVNFRTSLETKGADYIKNEVFKGFSDTEEQRLIIKTKKRIEETGIDEQLYKNGKAFKKHISGNMKMDDILDIVNNFGDEIESIQVDHQLVPMLENAVPKIRADLVWNEGFGGDGQTVCVIDTGIDYNHPNLQDKYIGGYDFVNNDDDPMDDNGHGTYIAGLIAGTAPGAKIVTVKALRNDGVGYESDIIAAINYCVDNKDLYGISVIAMALGGGSFDGYCDAVFVTSEANYATTQGIFVVAASGNSGTANLTAPACGTNVTSIGATNINDTIYCATSINPLLDLLAPGVGITSTSLGGGTETKSGTSVSTGIAAGAAALILQNEPLSPMELEYKFRSTGLLIGKNLVHYPRIDVYNAFINNITNTPSEQIGEQNDGDIWIEYKPSAGECDCEEGGHYPGGCPGGQYCSNSDCQLFEGNMGLCLGCFGAGAACTGSADDYKCCTRSCEYD
ncbi:MAG: S8 family serine peptidase [Candidatus Aenigmarchaeota archaeon]|nr:S8 family serine peptidase [Candidatus Aenigmarchaeota archaeon]